MALDGQLGYWNPVQGKIAIDIRQPEVGKHIVFLHEGLHLIEDLLLQTGCIKKRVDHGFIASMAPNLFAFLVAAGLWKGISKKQAFAFLQKLPPAPKLAKAKPVDKPKKRR